MPFWFLIQVTRCRKWTRVTLKIPRTESPSAWPARQLRLLGHLDRMPRHLGGSFFVMLASCARNEDRGIAREINLEVSICSYPNGLSVLYFPFDGSCLHEFVEKDLQTEADRNDRAE